jgi:hypothetical protein
LEEPLLDLAPPSDESLLLGFSLLELVDEPSDAEPDSVERESEDPERLRFSPDLKSVSYQPPPFRRNPAAEIFFTSLASPQDGQSFKGSSLIF